MTYIDRMELEARVEKIRANKQREQELEERALVDEEDKQEKERKQGQQKKLKEEAVVVPGMMAVLQMMMAHQAQQTQCMMQGFHGFASMLAGVSGMAGSSAAAAAAAAPGATTGPPPLPPPTSSKLGGGDIGAPPPAQASGVPLGNQGLINRRYNRGFLVRNRRGEGHVIKGSGTVTRHGGMAFPALTCLQIRRVSSLHIPSLVQTIVGSFHY